MTADHFRSTAIIIVAIFTTSVVATMGFSYAAERRGFAVHNSPSLAPTGCSGAL